MLRYLEQALMNHLLNTQVNALKQLQPWPVKEEAPADNRLVQLHAFQRVTGLLAEAQQASECSCQTARQHAHI